MAGKSGVRVGVVYNDGDRSGYNYYTVAIRIGGRQFNSETEFQRPKEARRVAKEVARVLGVEETEEASPVWPG